MVLTRLLGGLLPKQPPARQFCALTRPWGPARPGRWRNATLARFIFRSKVLRQCVNLMKGCAMTSGPSQSMNLGGLPSPYNDSFVALDLMKGAEGWRGLDDNLINPASLSFDARGWLTELPMQNGAEVQVYCNVLYGKLLPVGQYILEWEGDGVVRTNQPYTELGPNKILLSYEAINIDAAGNPIDDGFSVQILQSDPNNTGDYVRDIKLYNLQDADLIAAGERFDPVWMDRVDDFRVLRTHDWQETNFPSNVDWTRNVFSADQAHWGGDGRGMPYELLVSMANETRSDLWVNIPHTASDQYIREAAIYLKAHLDPGLRLQVEFSNEYWTTIFDQNPYFVAGGQAAFGDDPFATGQFYGTEAANMARIFNEVFGANSPILRPTLTVDDVMLTSGEAEAMLLSPANVAAGGTTTLSAGFEVLATDGYLLWQAGDPYYAGLITDWMTDADGGFGRARDFLINQLNTQLLPNWQAGRALADKYGLEFQIYEGGALLLNLGDNPNPVFTDFMKRFTVSDEMKQVYEAELAAWRTVGTGGFAWYADVGRPEANGDYGHWKGPNFIPDPRADAIVNANENTSPWWTGDDRPASNWADGDYAAGTAGANVMRGGAMADRLYGLQGNDRLWGFAGNDRLWGGAGTDRLFGGDGRDELNGGDGADRLTGGAGADAMTGGVGNDRFIFTQIAAEGDRITDFSSMGAGNNDAFLLSGLAFGHADGRILAATEFQSSNAATAQSAAVRFIYDRDDHKLYYDADGRGGQPAVLIATLQAGAVVSAQDILFY